MKLKIIYRSLLIVALEFPCFGDPTKPKPNGDPSEIAEAVRAAKEGRHSDAIAWVDYELETGDTPQKRRRRKAVLLAQVAVRLSEEDVVPEGNDYARQSIDAVSDALKFFKKDDDVTLRLELLSTKAFLYYYVLHETENARAAYLECLELSPGNPTFIEFLSRVTPVSGGDPPLDSGDPRPNTSDPGGPGALRLELVPVSGTEIRIQLHAERSEGWQVQTSSDLRIWTTLFETTADPASLIHQEGALSDQPRFYRAVSR